MQKQQIEELTSLGLSENEAKTYLALLEKEIMNVGEIAKVSLVPRPKIYGIIKGLIRKGFCIEKPGNIKGYSAVSPKIVSGRLLLDYQELFKSKEEVANKFVERYATIFDESRSKSDLLEYIEVLFNPRQIRERWLNIQKDTKEELLIFTKPPYTMAIDDNYDYESSIINKKVVVKSIYEYKDIGTVDNKNEFISIIEEYTKLGEDARVVEELPMKLVISDGTISMFALKDRISLMPSITTMIVNHPSFALALKKVFESYWNTGLSIQEYEKKDL